MPFIRIDRPDPAWLARRRREQLAEAREPKVRFDEAWSLERFLDENLAAVMVDRRYFDWAPKRVRKKKAKRFLCRWWAREMCRRLAASMVAPIQAHRAHASIGRQVFSVTPLS